MALPSVKLEPEALALGTTAPAGPGVPSWSFLDFSDGSRAAAELGLAVSELVVELRGRALDELPMST